MTVNSQLSSGGFACRKAGARLFSVLCAALFCLGLIAPLSAQAAAVTTIDKMQVVASLETTTTTIMTMTFGVPSTTALPCTVQFNVPGGYDIIQQGEFDSDPSQPTAQTKATQVSTGDSGTTYSVTLTKSRNYLVAARMPVSIYNYNAMGSGGVPIASFSLTPATDVTALTIAIAPPEANMVGTGGSSIQTFTAGDTSVYGQTFNSVKKGTAETIQVAFATQQQAQAGENAADQAAQQAQASGFFAQPIVWVLGAVLVIVIVILVVVIMRQHRGPVAAQDDSDEDDEDIEDDDDDDVKFNFDTDKPDKGAGASDGSENKDTGNDNDAAVDKPDSQDEEHATSASDS